MDNQGQNVIVIGLPRRSNHFG